MTAIGDRIAELRRQKGMTQEELAGIIGVSAQSVSKWENSITMPDIMLLPIIADIFSVSIDSLYGKTVNRYTSGVTFDNIADAAYDNLLETMQKAWVGSGGNEYSQEQLEDEAQKTREHLKEDKYSQTAIYSESTGAVYANADIGIIFKKPENEMTNLLLNDKAAALLAVLSNATVRKIMEYQLKNHFKSFTADSIANKLKLELNDIKAALDRLVEYAFTSKREIDIDNDSTCLYELYGGHKMLLVYSIIQLAGRLADYHENYHNFHGEPNAWLC